MIINPHPLPFEMCMPTNERRTDIINRNVSGPTPILLIIIIAVHSSPLVGPNMSACSCVFSFGAGLRLTISHVCVMPYLSQPSRCLPINNRSPFSTTISIVFPRNISIIKPFPNSCTRIITLRIHAFFVYRQFPWLAIAITSAVSH